MNKRLLAGIAILVLLVAGNVAWHIWSSWGLITVNADDAPLGQIVKSIEKQGGVRIVTNLPADQKVTLHVVKVPLVRALQSLADKANARWDMTYLAGPDAAWIEGALGSFSSDGSTAGWKVFAFQQPMMGMMGGGLVDPREERLDAVKAGKIQDFLQETSQLVDGQFWTPLDWNPDVQPKAGRVEDAVASAARSAGGKSARVVTLAARPQDQGRQNFARDGGGAAPGNGGGPPPGGAAGGARPQVDFEAMAKREQVRINALPEDRRAKAQKEFDERQKFFQSLASLPPEERAEKMREHMDENMRNNPGGMEAGMTRMDASHTVEERTNFFRMVIKHKEEANQ